MIVFVLVDLALRIWIGLSARAESKGKKKSAVYLVITAILILASVLNIVFLIFDLVDAFSLYGIVSIVVECTSLFALVEVFTSAISIHKLRKELF